MGGVNVNACSAFEKNYATGTTTNAYVSAITLASSAYKSGTIVIKNTHGTNTLTYKINGYAYEGGTAIADVAPADIAAGATVTYERTAMKPRAVIDVQVIDKVSGSHATYRVDYIQGQ